MPHVANTKSFKKKRVWRASEIAQWVKVLATKPDNLSSISSTYKVEGKERTSSYKLYSDLHTQ